MKIYQKALATVLAMLLVLTAASLPVWTAPAEGEPERELEQEESGPVLFSDVRTDVWYAESVYYCLAHGLMGGTSAEELVFEPFTSMTRAMLATILYRLAGEPETEAADNPFVDVIPELWYGPAVLWCSKLGYMQGYGDGRFGPNDTVDRRQIVTALWNLAGRPEPEGTGAPYEDEAEIDGWAADAVRWSRENAIFPYPNAKNFYPKSELPRYEIAPTLMNYHLLYCRGEDEDPEAMPVSWIPEVPPESGEEEPGDEPVRNEEIWRQFESRFGYTPEVKPAGTHTYIREGITLAENAAGKKYMSYREGDYAVGIDVSAWQKEIDWQAVADSGIQFAMLRAGYRGYSQGVLNLDSWFERNLEGALAAGIEVGVYYFCQSITIDEAVEEANFVLDHIRGYNVTYPIVFDWERQNKEGSRTRYTDDDTIVACGIAFCETVKAAGYIPAFYGSANKLKRLEMGYLADYPCWLAHYTIGQAPSRYEGAYDLWQYSSSWSVPGVKGNCDVDICFTDWSGWREALFGTGEETPPPESTEAPAETAPQS